MTDTAEVLAEERSDLPPLFPDEEVSDSELGKDDHEAESTLPTGEKEATQTERAAETGTETEPDQNGIDFKQLVMEADLFGEPDDQSFDGFKELNEQEYEDLLDEDPDEATRYLHRLNRYKDWRSNKEQRFNTKQNMAWGIVGEAVQEMEELVPGISSGKSEAGDALAKFCIEHGCDPTFLNWITSPNSRLIPSGSKKAILLGKGASSLVRMLKNIYDKSTPQRQGQRPKLKDGKIPIKEETSYGLTASESDYARMNAAEREKFLRG